jgi:diadenylate cyclase
MARSPEESLKATLARVAPGTPLRDGLERILRGRTGALIVLGYDRTIDSICSGGFDIGIDFSPTRLRELAKMDGAIICDKDASNIVRAAVQLVPDSSIETQESGTRHRTAERVAIQTGVPVISVSQSMQIIALYVNGLRHVLEGSEKVLARANQALATSGTVQRQAGPGHQLPFRPGDRGIGHGQGRCRHAAAPGNGSPHLRGNRPVRAGTR